MKLNLHRSDIQPNRGSTGRPRNTCLRPSINPVLARKSGTNRAFTLIELLVVIAIIAVLAAMLLPTLASAKNRAQMAIDLNNIHQIMMAAHLYAGDNNGYLPRADQWSGVPSWCFSSQQAFAPWLGGIGNYNLYYPQQVRSFHGLDPVSGATLLRKDACQFVPYLKNEKVLRCPADIPCSLMYKRQLYITSYTWNVSFHANYDTPTNAINGVCCPNATVKVSQFKGDDILLWENDELRVLTDSVSWNDTYGCPDEGVTSRHGKGGTIGNADGSAERILLRDFYMMACNRPVKTGSNCTGWNNGQHLPNRLWNNPLRGNGV